MDDLILILFLVSLVCLIISFFKADLFYRLFKTNSKKRIRWIWGILTILLFISFGIFAEEPVSTESPIDSEAQTEIISTETQPLSVDNINTQKQSALELTETEIKTETKEVTETEEIPFETINQNDSTLDKGQAKIKQEGQVGKKEIIYKVTYENNIEVDKKKESEKITIAPVNKIILNGTKTYQAPASTAILCGSDYYVNVDGNCVHRPSDNPSGASAKCKDGSYSYSQHRRGTCSGHGGVAQWL